MKRIFFLFIFFVLIGSVYSVGNSECFDILKEKSDFVDIGYDEYSQEILDSEFYLHMNVWDLVSFYDPKVYVKLYGIGDETSFKYELKEYESLKFGKLNWPKSNEYMFFEQYVENENGVKEFTGCGLIKLGVLGDYSLDTLDERSFLGCKPVEIEREFEDLETSFYSSEFTSCYDYDSEPSMTFQVDRVLINNVSNYINFYDVAKNYAKFESRYREIDSNVFYLLYLEKVYHNYNFSSDLRYGYLPLDWFEQDFEKIVFPSVSKDIMMNFDPIVLFMDDLDGVDYDNYTYSKYLFMNIEKDEFRVFLDEIVMLDSVFGVEVLRGIEGNCLDLKNYTCIGFALTDYLKEESSNVNAINFYVDSVLRYENSFYDLEYENMVSIFENQEFIFEIRDVVLDAQNNVPFAPKTSFVSGYEWSNLHLVYIVVMIVIAVLIVVLAYRAKHD